MAAGFAQLAVIFQHEKINIWTRPHKAANFDLSVADVPSCLNTEIFLTWPSPAKNKG